MFLRKMVRGVTSFFESGVFEEISVRFIDMEYRMESFEMLCFSN